MPKLIKQQEIDLIEKTVSNFVNGATGSELLAQLNGQVHIRTLQRRLAQLIKSGKLRVTGAGKSRRYAIIPAGTETTLKVVANITPDSVPVEYSIPITAEANQVRQYVQQKIQYRQPVAYERSFLENYQPNQTFYLPEAIRKKFSQEGKLDHAFDANSTYTKQILARLLIDLSWNSSRLEGNTYSLLETEHLLVEGKEAEGKNRFETQMILNHKAAINFLASNNKIIDFNAFIILNLHALLADELLGNSAACGRLRSIPVGISRTVYHPPEIPQIIEECFYKILQKASEIKDPFEQAFFSMVHLPYLQPFEDVNKRVSRLAANIPFMKYHLCPLSFIHVPEEAYIEGTLGVYECRRVELLRDVFIFAYERSIKEYAVLQHTLGEPDPFRFRYRQKIKEIVASVVIKKLDKQAAALFIKEWAEHNLSEHDRAEFITVIETELLTLTEGNIARYKLSLAQFSDWQKKWNFF